ncbi:MAG: HEPN domain-containing protein [Candidatus Nealsonbacteria bacterium]|nr:MAG: HEPN domain-containing protein [Candidatus Nealsonbacteria bacterium]
MTKEDFEKIKELEDKARKIESEAKRLKGSGEYDLSVRRSQEAFELYLKFIFTVLDKEVREIWGHELSSLIDKETEAIKKILKEYLNFSESYIDEIMARIKLGSLTLNLWRNLAFYGDEKLKKYKFFKQKEAELALEYVSELSTLSAWIKNYFNNKFYS